MVRKGQPCSEEHKRKLSDARKKYNETHPGPNLGKTFGEDVREKIRRARLGKKASPEARKKMGDSRRGKPRTHDMSGPANPFYGHHHSDESRAKLREARSKQTLPPVTPDEREARSIRMMGENNPMKRPEVVAKVATQMVGRFSGENNPSYVHGMSRRRYCRKYNDALKEHIRDKFGRKCFLCGASEDSCRARMPTHHVDYNKNTLCNGKNWGIVPLCDSCHSRTNSNRWYWFALIGNWWAMNQSVNFMGVDYYFDITNR